MLLVVGEYGPQKSLIVTSVLVFDHNVLNGPHNSSPSSETSLMNIIISWLLRYLGTSNLFVKGYKAVKLH